MIKKLQYALGAAAFIFILVTVIIYRDSVSAGIYRGIGYSLSVLIPSLLPFIFISCLFSGTGSAKIMCRILSPVTRYVFRLPECCGTVILFGLTCGYPVGAKLTSDLLNKGRIDKKDAARLTIFTLNPGIPFCVLFLGSVVFHSMSSGFIIYLSVTIASLILGIILSIKNHIPPKGNDEYVDSGFFITVKNSADGAIRSCLNMSFYIIIFWGFMALMYKSGAFAFLVRTIRIPFVNDMERAGLFSFIFEVTGGISDSVRLKISKDIFVMGLAFGGICIHLQIYSFFKVPPVSYIKFLLFRVLHAVLSLGVFNIFKFFMPEAIATASLSDPIMLQGMKMNFIGSLCLLILFITYVFMTEKETVEKKKK